MSDAVEAATGDGVVAAEHRRVEPSRWARAATEAADRHSGLEVVRVGVGRRGRRRGRWSGGCGGCRGTAGSGACWPWPRSASARAAGRRRARTRAGRGRRGRSSRLSLVRPPGPDTPAHEHPAVDHHGPHEQLDGARPRSRRGAAGPAGRCAGARPGRPVTTPRAVGEREHSSWDARRRAAASRTGGAGGPDRQPARPAAGPRRAAVTRTPTGRRRRGPVRAAAPGRPETPRSAAAGQKPPRPAAGSSTQTKTARRDRPAAEGASGQPAERAATPPRGATTARRRRPARTQPGCQHPAVGGAALGEQRRRRRCDVDPPELGLGVEDQAVVQHRLGQLLHVLGHHVVATVGGGPHLGHPDSARQPRAERPSRTCGRSREASASAAYVA